MEFLGCQFFSLSNLDCKAGFTVSSPSILILVYACVIVVLYRVDIEVMSRPGFKCRAAFVAHGGNPDHFLTLSVNVSSFFRWFCDIVCTISRNRIEGMK